MRKTDLGAREVADATGETCTASTSHRERDRALALVGKIYDGALEPSRWADVIRGVVEFVGGAKGALFASATAAPQGRFVVAYRLSESFLQRWQDKHVDRDPWSKHALKKGLYVEGRAALGTDFVPEDRLRQSPEYRDLAEHEGIGQVCTGVVFGPRPNGLSPTLCSAFRSLEEARFTDRERERMGVLVPHLSRALGVMFRLRNAELQVAASLAALDRLARGVLLLAEHGHVIFANRVAQRLVDERDGLLLRSARFNGGLRNIVAGDASTQARIDEAIADCLDEQALRVAHFSRGIGVHRPSGRADLALQFAPLPRENEYDADGRRARVIVFVTDPNGRTDVDASTLAKLYRLTRAESRLALQLCSGETLSDAAKKNGITIATARTQLAAVFQKTGTTRQAALMRLLVALGSTRGDWM